MYQIFSIFTFWVMTDCIYKLPPKEKICSKVAKYTEKCALLWQWFFILWIFLCDFQFLRYDRFWCMPLCIPHVCKIAHIQNPRLFPNYEYKVPPLRLFRSDQLDIKDAQYAKKIRVVQFHVTLYRVWSFRRGVLGAQKIKFLQKWKNLQV